ncbi:uncharacterized protein LOC120131027 [Hibiscus syriacus]|uniref:uncharacterized protein LOC120131027 n=1 Tax=Hibiscus syriacus TaxID=106335 RepID=UPI0019220AD4|nr:uncharacterized protein LOC120131027 [Hibiscus syriacus]
MGINNPLKQLKVLRRFDACGVDVICVMESRIKRVNSDRFSNALAGDWNFAENYDFVEGGRLWIFWRKHLLFTVLRCCDQAITIIGAVDGHMTTIIAIYGSGDFNIIAKLEESSDFDVMGVHCTPDIKDFQECLEGLYLIDHPFLRPLFTLSNKQDDSYLARKLDRILVNDQWLLDFLDSFVEYKARGSQCAGSAMSYFFNKLRRLKPLLKELNNEFFCDISGRVRAKRSEWEQIQTFNLAHTTQRRTDEERRVHFELVDLETAEAIFYKQKAKAHWLRDGDLNTKFFHHKVQANKKRNTIRVIKSEDEQLFESFKDMAAELCSARNLKDLINVCLSDGADVYLTKEVSDVEIKEALFRKGNDKSPGPNGYTIGFFKAAWSIVGSDFTSAVRYFFQTSYLLPAFNSTALVLVPKFPNATLAKEFRPISCCSVVYKTITRILVDRLTTYFPGLISHNQSAFVKGRNIVDNTLLAQEIVKGYSKKNLSPRCTVKIDLQKAFDSVNWDFLLSVLGAMGLPDFSGYFKGARGIRQRDSLSPCLFVIVINVLSSLLNAAAKRGIFRYHPKCKRVSLTHLCFADDLLVFCHGSLESVLGVQSTLEVFYELSGLKLNALKTDFFVCGLNTNTLDLIHQATGFKIAQLPVRYLEVPLVTRNLTGKDCSALLERIKGKLAQWSSKKLSFGGRLQLKGCDAPARGARVSWSQVCSPKSESGLGLKSLALWSKACCLLLIKNILANDGLLWIAWLRAYCLKVVSFWEVEYKACFSWIFKKLLKLREEARNLFLPCSNWNLIKGKWIWDQNRVRAEKVSWHRIIWFPAHILKFSLIVWMATLDRLPTRDRLIRFGLVLDNGCVLCGSGIESCDHLFADCSFT